MKKTQVLVGATGVVSGFSLLIAFSSSSATGQIQSILPVNSLSKESCAGSQYGRALTTDDIRTRAVTNPNFTVRKNPPRAFEIFALTSIGLDSRRATNEDSAVATTADGITSFVLEMNGQYRRYPASVFIEATIEAGNITRGTRKGKQALKYINDLATKSGAVTLPGIDVPGVGYQRAIPILVFITASNTFIGKDIVEAANRASNPVLIIQQFACDYRGTKEKPRIGFLTDMIVGLPVDLNQKITNTDIESRYVSRQVGVQIPTRSSEPSSLFASFQVHSRKTKSLDLPQDSITEYGKAMYMPSSPTPSPTPPCGGSGC